MDPTSRAGFGRGWGFVTHLWLSGMFFKDLSANPPTLSSHFIILASSDTAPCIGGRVVVGSGSRWQQEHACGVVTCSNGLRFLYKGGPEVGPTDLLVPIMAREPRAPPTILDCPCGGGPIQHFFPGTGLLAGSMRAARRWSRGQSWGLGSSVVLAALARMGESLPKPFHHIHTLGW